MNSILLKRHLVSGALIVTAICVSTALCAATFSDTNWVNFGGVPGPSGNVYATVLDTSGNLYAGGFFTRAGATSAVAVAKWDGTNWSRLGSGMNDGIWALAVSGSNLYAGGVFTLAGGSPANYIAKWDGSNWSGLGSGMNGNVDALAVSGTNVYAGGRFTSAGGVAATRIAKWDGSRWSPLGSGFNNTVLALKAAGTNLYAAGFFTTAGGVPANRIARWNGSSWSALGSGLNDWALGLAVLGDDLYVGGGFTTAGGGPANRVAKWNGSTWSALGGGFSGGAGLWFPAGVYALAVSSSHVYAGGDFTHSGGLEVNHIAKWDGSNWSAFGSGTDAEVQALAISGSELYAAGNFTNAGGKVSGHVARAILEVPPTNGPSGFTNEQIGLNLSGSAPSNTVIQTAADPAQYSKSRFRPLHPNVPLDRLSSGSLMLLDRGGDLVRAPLRKDALPPSFTPKSTDPSVVAGLDPRVGLNLQLGPDPPQLPITHTAQAEPHIVRDPLNPDTLLAIFQEGRYAGPKFAAIDCGYSVSRDGGLSWTRALIPELTFLSDGPYFRASDPVAGIDLAGNMYLNTICSLDYGVVAVSRSTNGGATFDPPVEVFRQPSNRLLPDKNWMAIDTFAQSATAGRIVVTWTMVTAGYKSIVSSYSDDSGLTWSPYAYATPASSDCQGSQPVFLPHGTLALVYWNFSSSLTSGAALELVTSTNGGASFTGPRLITRVTEYVVPNIRTAQFLPSVTADRSSGALYVTYQARYQTAPRIMFTRSVDSGVTWTIPKPVSDNPATVAVFNPAVAVSDNGQAVTIQFYDQRVSPSQANLVDIFLAQSMDGGDTWQPNLRLTTVSSDVRLAPVANWGGYMLGDYQGIAPANPPHVPAVPVWIDTRSGTPDPFVTRVGIASQLTFSSWRAARFSVSQIGDPHISGPGADADGDGVANTLEYAFGLNPWQTDEAEFGLKLSGSAASAGFTTTYERLSTASDLTYDWLGSADLVSWSAAIPTNVVTTPNPPRLTETVTSSFPGTTNARQFYWLKVHLND